MKIVAVNFRSDITQIVEGKINKSTLTIVNVGRVRSIFPVLNSLKQEAVEDFLFEIREQVKYKNAEAYFSIADDLVKKIDCAGRDYVLPEEWEKEVYPWVSQMLQLNKDEYYITTPLHFQKKNRSLITGIAIRTTYIDLLFKAAMAVEFDLQMIEPSCYALLRYLNQWEREHCIMEVGETSTSIVSYNPVRGMFKMGSSYGWAHFLDDGKEEFEQCIASHDYTAYSTHGLANMNVPIYLISQKSQDLLNAFQDTKFSERLKKIPLGNFDGYLLSKLPEQEIINFGVPIGLALAPLHERMISYGNTAS